MAKTLGLDNANSTDDKDDAYEPAKISLWDAIRGITDELGKKGYRVVPEQGGLWSGFNIYRAVVPQVLLQPGLNVQGKPYLEALLPQVDSHRSLVKSLIDGVIADIWDSRLISTNDRKVYAKMYEKVWQSWVDRPLDHRSSVYTLAQSLWRDTHKTVSLDGAPGHKVVPVITWFPEAVQRWNPEELLSILPPAERKLFALAIGRMVVGSQGTPVAEGGVVEHKFRSFFTLTGEPQNGKSSLTTIIREGLEKLGYSVAMLDPTFGKFGWRKQAISDLSFIDDLTTESQKAMFSSRELKTIVSNDYLSTQDKGENSVEVRSRAVVLGCSNRYSPSDLIGLDDGILNRLCQLNTYGKRELDKQYKDHDGRTWQHFDYWQKELGVSRDVLVFRLFRHCADLFLEVTGQAITPSGLQCVRSSRLETYVERYRADLRIATTIDHAKEIPDKLAILVAAAIAESNKLMKHIDKLDKVEMSPMMVACLLNIQLDSVPGCLRMDQLGHSVKDYIKGAMINWVNIKQYDSIDAHFRAILSALKSDQGFGYPEKMSYYYPLWTSAKDAIPDLVENMPELPICANEAVSMISGMLAKVMC